MVADMDMPELETAVAEAAAEKTDRMVWKAEPNWLRLANGLVVMVETDDELLAEYAPTGVRFLEHFPRQRKVA